MPEISFKRLWHRYFQVNSPQFFKKLLLLIPLLQPKFYPLITLCSFFSSLFTFIIDNCNHGSLLRKCLKMKTFLLFTIVYSKINIDIVKTILPRQYFADAHQRQYRFPLTKALAIAKCRGKFRRLLKNMCLKNFTKLSGKHLCQSLFCS